MADYTKAEIDEIVRQAKAQKGHTVKVITRRSPTPRCYFRPPERSPRLPVS